MANTVAIGTKSVITSHELYSVDFNEATFVPDTKIDNYDFLMQLAREEGWTGARRTIQLRQVVTPATMAYARGRKYWNRDRSQEEHRVLKQYG